MAAKGRGGVGFTTERFPGQRYDGGMHEGLEDGEEPREQRGGVMDDINNRIVDITGRLPYPHGTDEELLESDFTVICTGYDRVERRTTSYFLRFGFAVPRGAPEGTAPVPVVERLDSKGQFRGYEVTDTVMLLGDSVTDADGNDRGDAGRELMKDLLDTIDIRTAMRASDVTSRGRQVWND